MQKAPKEKARRRRGKHSFDRIYLFIFIKGGASVHGKEMFKTKTF